MLSAWVLSGLMAVAHAGTAECQSCCASVGVTGCDAELRVYGAETRVAVDPGGWSLQGLWVVDCSGASHFDQARTVYLDHSPEPGEIAMPEAHPRAVGCFLSTCALPRDLCASPPDPDGNRTLSSCTSGRPADGQALQQAPAPPPPPVRVVIDGQVLPTNPTPPALPTAPVVASVPPPPVVPTTAASSAAVAALFTNLPPDATPDCRTPSEAARTEARSLVLAGDELRAHTDPASALARYKAALGIDRCNAYAWMGLGIAARSLDRPDIAVRALRDATSLMPSHYGGWTELGKAYEALGQYTGSADAFRRALTVKPGYPEAAAGLARVTQRLAGP